MTHHEAQGLVLSLLIGLAVGLLFGLIINWRVASKAGYNGWLSLVALVPLVGLVFLWIFAFKPWPIEKKIAELERERDVNLTH